MKFSPHVVDKDNYYYSKYQKKTTGLKPEKYNF